MRGARSGAPAPGAPNAEALLLRGVGGELPLAYAQDPNGRIYLVATRSDARWPTDVLREGRAEVVVEGRRLRARARLVADRPAIAAILDRLRAKYGDRRFAAWYAAPGRVLVLDPPGPTEPETGSYFDWLESEFDQIAAEYDHHIRGNRMNRLLRDRSIARMRLLFRGRSPLLEIGCGSGMETIELLRAGHELTAIDISQAMLDVVRRKAAQEGLAERIRLVHLRAAHLGALRSDVGAGGFAGAFSTYGALNCEPDLTPIALAAADLLAPDAPFLAGVYNRYCLFEMAGYALVGRFARARGRWSVPVRVGASRFCVDVYAYTVADVARAFAPAFRPADVEGAPVLLPPSDLVRYAEIFSRRFDRLAAWDAWLGRRAPWNRLGDHFLLTMRRRRDADAVGAGHLPLDRAPDRAKEAPVASRRPPEIVGRRNPGPPGKPPDVVAAPTGSIPR